MTGDRLTAQDAKEAGLVSKVFPVQQLVQEAIILADRIAKNSPLILKTVKVGVQILLILDVSLLKKSVSAAYETTLTQGLEAERQLFQSTFATVIFM